MAVAVILVLSQVFSLAGKAMQISRFFEIASFACGGLDRCLDFGAFAARSIGVADTIIPMITLNVIIMLTVMLMHTTIRTNTIIRTNTTVIACCSSHEQEAKTARRSIWAMVVAVGIRPCTGAVLVLLFSLSAGIFVWGLVATFAMGAWHCHYGGGAGGRKCVCTRYRISVKQPTSSLATKSVASFWFCGGFRFDHH